MAHANAKLILEVEATDASDCVEMLENLDEESEFIETDDYPEEPHPDSLINGMYVSINGNRHKWSYGGGGEYEGNYENLGFYLGFTPKKYDGRTDLNEVRDKADDMLEFAEAVQDYTDRRVEDYITVVTV